MKAKKIIAAVLCAAVVAVVPMFAACSSVYVTSIECTDSNGLEDTYTITYSDGSTTTFTITNGTSSAEELLEVLWDKYNEATGQNLTYEQFLALYLSDVSSATAVGNCLLSSMKIYAEFIEQASTTNNTPMYQGSGYTKSLYTGGAVIYRMYDDYTYIVTNYHVIYDSRADESKNGGCTPYKNVVYGYLYGSEGEPSEAGYDDNGYAEYDYGDYVIELKYIGGSASADIAVLCASTNDILAINEYAQAVTIAESYSVGDTAIAIGNPNDGGISVTKGIISMVDEYISLNIDGTPRSYRSIRIDTALYSGNSGGGLFNASGELIGIANAGSSDEENINYGVPIEIVTGVADSIIYYSGSAKTVDIGLKFTSQNSKYVYNQVTGRGAIEEEVVVSEVASSIGSELGLQTNDIITKLVVTSGETTTTYSITRIFNLSDIQPTLREDDVIYFIYERDSVSKTTSKYTIKQSDLTLLE